MSDAGVIEFTKMQGAGNDFLVLDNRSYAFSREELSELAATWCPRRYGVGADGLLALDEPATSAAAYRMHYVNADGSRATMCGNGARCLARFARRVGFETSELVFDTDAGQYRAVVGEGTHVRLFVPDVTDVRSEVPLDRDVPDDVEALFYAHAGTEHLVALVRDLDAVPVQEWGAYLRRDPHLAPAGANVNFVRPGESGEIHVRTYEKGVEEETLSCGTGVVAAAVVAERAGWVQEDPLPVHTRGGILAVGTASTDRGMERYLDGPAVSVYTGTLDVPDGGAE